MSENNATMADEQSQLVGKKAKIDRMNIDYRVQYERNRGRSQFAASGIQLDSGSAAEWEADLDQGGAVEKAAITSDAEQVQWKLGVEKQSHLAEAGMYYRSYKNLKRAAKVGFFASTLGNVGQQGQQASSYWGSFGGGSGGSSFGGGK
jgi:hypothetical protein